MKGSAVECSEDVPGHWKSFPNAVRRTAWEVVQSSERDQRSVYAVARLADKVTLFKALMAVMRAQELPPCGEKASSERLKQALVRARPMMDACLEATRRHGWIDFPLTGKEPYMDGTFPEAEKDENCAPSGVKEVKVEEESEKEEEEEEKEEEKEEQGGSRQKRRMEEVEMDDIDEEDEESEDDERGKRRKKRRTRKEERNEEEEEEEEENLMIPLFSNHQLKMRRRGKEDEEEELSTRDYGKFLEAALDCAISKTNFTASEKGGIKRAIRDNVFKGIALREAAVKHGVAPQRLVAFATKTRQECRRMRSEQEAAAAGPSTSSAAAVTSPSPRPPLTASDEEKRVWVEKQLEAIVDVAKLNSWAKQLLKRAVLGVVWEGVSMAEASTRIGIPASTMHPYVTKARAVLGELAKPVLTGKEKRAVSYRSVSTPEAVKKGGVQRVVKKEEEASVDEITYVINEVIQGVDKARRDVFYEMLVEILTGAASPLAACAKRNIGLSSLASYLARARSRLDGRLPQQMEDPRPVVDDKQPPPYEKGTVVLEGKYRLPQSMNEICKMIDNGELSYVEAAPFEGTREELKARIRNVVSRFRYQPFHLFVADAVLRILVEHVDSDEASAEFDLPPITVCGYSKIMRLLIDMNNLTIIDEDGTRRAIPPKENYERAKRKRRWFRRPSGGSNVSDDEEDEGGDEEDGEEGNNEEEEKKDEEME